MNEQERAVIAEVLIIVRRMRTTKHPLTSDMLALENLSTWLERRSDEHAAQAHDQPEKV